MKEYLQKQFYRSDMKMLIRFADWSPENPRPFIFTYQNNTSNDTMKVSCDRSGVLSVKFNGKLIENSAQICDQGVRVFKSYPHFQPGRIKVFRNYPQLDNRYAKGVFNSESPEQTTIEITDINDIDTMSSQVEEFVEQLKGEPGISAFDYARSKGYDKGEEQFAADLSLIGSVSQMHNYASTTPFKTGDKFFNKQGQPRDVWSASIEVKGILVASDAKSVFIKTSSLPMDSILSVRGFFYTSASQAIFPIGMTPANSNTNLFCDSNGTSFYTNIIMPSSYAGMECTAYVNVLYTI